MGGYGSRAGQRGSAAVLGTVLVAVLMMVAVLVAAVGGAVADSRRAASAADLAALAGASALQAGKDGCAAARSNARRNGARVSFCRVDGQDVTVHTERSTQRVLGRRFTVRAVARAGPDPGSAERGWTGTVRPPSSPGVLGSSRVRG